jgi:hypothetical protein
VQDLKIRKVCIKLCARCDTDMLPAITFVSENLDGSWKPNLGNHRNDREKWIEDKADEAAPLLRGR